MSTGVKTALASDARLAEWQFLQVTPDFGLEQFRISEEKHQGQLLEQTRDKSCSDCKYSEYFISFHFISALVYLNAFLVAHGRLIMTVMMIMIM